MQGTMPLVILGGSDLSASRLPETGAEKHSLAAYKGVALQLGGRPLVEIIAERFRAAGLFDPIWIAGPRHIHGDVGGIDEIIDTDASLGENVRVAMDHFLAHYSEGMLAFTVSDILPDPSELASVVARFRGDPPCDIWFPVVRTPDDPRRLGEFAWKPRYRLVRDPGAEPLELLPGHLLLVDPRSLRLGLVDRLADITYRTRNRSIDQRRGRMVRFVIGMLLYHDLLHLLALRAPTLTWTVLRNGLRAARRLQAGTLTVAGLERALTAILVRARHRRQFRERGVRLPVVDALSLAEDVDTQEEAHDLETHWRPGDA